MLEQSSDVRCLLELSDSQIVSGNRDNTLRIWNTNTGSIERTLTGHESAVGCVSALPNGRFVSGSDDTSLRIWNANTGACERTLTGHTSALSVAGWLHRVGQL